MKITFLGTSHGVPEKDRYCSCTMIETGGGRYLIDIGAPAIDLLIRRGIPLDSIRGIFITHPHGDHTNGLVAFADLLTWYFKTPDPLIHIPSPALETALNAWIDATQNSDAKRLRFKTVSGGELYDDGALKVTAIPTQHCPNSFAYMLEAEGKRAVFTGDLAGPKKDFPAVCFEKHCDLIVCEAAHFIVSDAVEVFDRCLTDRVIINHINPRRNAEVVTRLAAEPHPYEFRGAFDGMELTL